MTSPRFITVVALMALTWTLMRARGDVDRVPPSVPLNQMPQTLGPWKSTDVPLTADVLEILGKGVFLNRIYRPTDPALASASNEVGLFIGYFPTQRTGQAIHSPQNCLPGSGWVFESSGVTTLKTPAGQPFQVGEYLISNGTSKDEVLYWYRSHGRSMASDYVAKLYTLVDSIRYNRTDAALIRVVVPLASGATRQAAHDRAVDFAQQLSPLLPAYIPD